MNANAVTPAPGLVWGSYPQNVAGEMMSDLRRRMKRTGRRIGNRMASVSQPIRLARHRAAARQTLQQMERLSPLSDARLRRMAERLRGEMAVNGLTESNINSAIALVSVQCRRKLKQTPYATQIIACRILLNNRLAEMATGEGKSLACAMCATVAAMAGIPVHVLTANDYLVRRDQQKMRTLFSAFGLSSASVVAGQTSDQRRAAYASDIVYATAREIVFDYLRDRVSLSMTDPDINWQVAGLCGDTVQLPPLLLRGLCMGIVDEADSILLDEATMPLILSRQRDDAVREAQFREIHALAKSLWVNRHFELNTNYRNARLTQAGKDKVESQADESEVLRAIHPRDLIFKTEIAIAAIHLFHRDRDYLVRDGATQLIDSTTGRVAVGKVWSRGLQQMVEIKEELALSAPTETIAQITYQQFFGRYLRLSGLSGSLTESAGELAAVYCLTVETVPLRLASQRQIQGTEICRTSERKWEAILARVKSAHAGGRPILIAIESVRQAELASERLRKHKLEHQVLSAANDTIEAQIIARAGLAGAITIATNMAGRGTDIVVGDAVEQCGGLLLIVCHHNDERRLDRQLFGRTARQGQPGEVLRIASLDQDLPAFVGRGLQWLAINRATPGRVATVLARLSLYVAQRLNEARRRRLRIQILDAGIARDRMLAPSGAGE